MSIVFLYGPGIVPFIFIGLFLVVAILLGLGVFIFLYRGIDNVYFRIGWSIWIGGFCLTCFRMWVTDRNAALSLPGSELLFDQRLVRHEDLGVIFKYFALLGLLSSITCLLFVYGVRRWGKSERAQSDSNLDSQ